ncbi:MAG: glycosyltransferase [Colwellia sp.]
MNKKKLLFIVDKIENGGAERQMLKIAKLYRDNFEIEVMSIYPPSKDMLEQLEALSFTYIQVSSNSNNSNKLSMIWAFYKTLKRRLIQQDFKAVFSFLEWSNVLTTKALLKSGKRESVQLILNVRNYLSNQYESKSGLKLKVAKSILKKYYNLADKVLCNSNAIKQDLKDNFYIKAEKIEVIYNSLDHKTLKIDAAKHIEFTTDKLNFVTCGRLAPQKQLKSLLLTFHQYNRELKNNDHLYVIGSGPQQNELEELIKEKKINATLVGHKSNVAAWFNHADCFVLNSYFEGFPNVLAEAIALGTYSIVADCLSGPREIMTDFQEVDYKKQLPDVFETHLGVLYRCEYSNEENKSLFNALVQYREKILTHDRSLVRSKLMNENFGVNEWRKVLDQ